MTIKHSEAKDTKSSANLTEFFSSIEEARNREKAVVDESRTLEKETLDNMRSREKDLVDKLGEIALQFSQRPAWFEPFVEHLPSSSPLLSVVASRPLALPEVSKIDVGPPTRTPLPTFEVIVELSKDKCKTADIEDLKKDLLRHCNVENVLIKINAIFNLNKGVKFLLDSLKDRELLMGYLGSSKYKDVNYYVPKKF
ncbi:hypothetical protein JTE90_004030 [Oedothorax gibbosus]|uniref:Uncharacterized protein n=1 Tax=Oedothorax gibbosus TaxID=931172 RepID=A0AAV6U3Z6_9ARAC|nr:hypothetical protein JTE90_004030 [Oedothorax gibbosus]